MNDMKAMPTITSMPIEDIVAISEHNVRQIQPTVEQQKKMERSIKTNGVIFPIVVEEVNDGYAVIDGYQRYRAAKAAGLKSVPVIKSCADAAMNINASLVLNVRREEMHPVDQWKAIRALHEEGWTNSQIENSLGISKKLQAQLASLGNLTPVVLDCYAADGMDESAVQAFTLVNEDQQEALLEKIQKEIGNRRIGRWDVTHATGLDQRKLKGQLELVGMEAYKKAGGEIRADLFGDDDIIVHPKIVVELYDKLFAKLIRAIKKEGWGDVRTERPDDMYRWKREMPNADDPDHAWFFKEQDLLQAKQDACAQIEDEDVLLTEQAALDKEQDELDHRFYESIIPVEERANRTVFVYPDYEQKIHPSYGWISPAQVEPVAHDPETGEITEAAEPEPDSFQTSSALAQRMRGSYWAAVKQSIELATKIKAGTLPGVLRYIVADMIDPERYHAIDTKISGRVDDILETIEPRIVLNAFADRFDAEDFFKSQSMPALVKFASTELGLPVADLPEKKKALVAVIVEAHGKVSALKRWMPYEMRHPHYEIPAS